MAHTRYTELAQAAGLGALLLLSVACAVKPAPRAARAPERASEPSQASASPEQPDVDATSTQPTASGTPATTPATVSVTEPALPGEPPPLPAPPPFKSEYLWFCMQWIHLDASGINCYPTLKECREEQRDFDGYVVVGCHAARRGPWCTKLAAESEPASPQYCYRDEADCRQFRLDSAKLGLKTIECAEVRTKK